MNTEKPWAGSRAFGMAFYDQQSQVSVSWDGAISGQYLKNCALCNRQTRVVPTHLPTTRTPIRRPLTPIFTVFQGLASIGTLLEITDHANLEDGEGHAAYAVCPCLYSVPCFAVSFCSVPCLCRLACSDTAATCATASKLAAPYSAVLLCLPAATPLQTLTACLRHLPAFRPPPGQQRGPPALQDPERALLFGAEKAVQGHCRLPGGCWLELLKLLD